MCWFCFVCFKKMLTGFSPIFAQASQRRNAALGEKFYFRRNIMTKTQAACGPEPPAAEEAVLLMSLNDIINGQSGGFVGLIPLIELYLNTINIDAASRCTICKYLSLVSGRAAGKLSTTASFIRDFVARHPAYKHGARW
jgi:glutamate--cysteine ligase catalytic subunit